MKLEYSIDIIIVNYKSTDYLINCLHSIYDNVDSKFINIYIQDNSCDNEIDKVNTIYPDAQIIKNKRNIGFSAAVNSAINQGDSPYIILLNPDSTIKHDFLTHILNFMDENSDVGILGPKILNNDETIQGSARTFPTPLTGFFGRTSLLTKLFPNNWITRKTILSNDKNGAKPIEVDWVSGACMVIRRDAIQHIGLMDEQFFMYFEDVDWCKRMWANGWKVIYYPMACITHQVGGSSDKRPVQSIYNFHVSCYLYFMKYPAWPLWILKPVTILGLSFRFILLLILFYSRQSYNTKSHEHIPKILFLITEDWYFWSHRLPIARRAKEKGYTVVIATRVHNHEEKILNEGFQLVPLRLRRRSKNIVKEIRNLFEIVALYKRKKPDVVHHVGIKPILYGSWAAKIAGVPSVINAFAGLGFVFIAKGKKSDVLRKIVEVAYRSAFLHKNAVSIFQNAEDLEKFVELKIVKRHNTILIKGSGVNTSVFRYVPEANSVPKVVLASRMLWDKGINEFVNAAKIVKRDGIKCHFILVGAPDPENPMSISEEKLKQWHQEGIVEWWGLRNDIPYVFSQANIICLPSYREGLPKVLLEAASCGRAIVATDVPGCREIVRHNDNGILVPPYESMLLAEAFLKLLNNPELRHQMGKRSREIVEAEFTEEHVVRQTMDLYQKLLL